jgi:hypothetical protein
MSLFGIVERPIVGREPPRAPMPRKASCVRCQHCQHYAWHPNQAPVVVAGTRHHPGCIICQPNVIVGIDTAFASASPELLFPYADPIIRSTFPGFNTAQRQIVGAIGYFESRFGVQGAFAPGGKPTYNWGAVTGSGNAGSIQAQDHDKNGKLITVNFRKYLTAKDGLLDFAKIWAKPQAEMLQLAGNGDAQGVAERMFRNGYYVGFGDTEAQRIGGYAKAIYGAAKAYAAVMKEPLAVDAPAGASTTPYIPAGGGTTVEDIDDEDIDTNEEDDSGISPGGVMFAFGLAGAAAWGISRAFR